MEMFPLCDYSITYPLTTETFNYNQNLLKGISDLSTIGSRIKYYRLLNNLTQEDLAAKSNLDRATIIRYENNLVNHSIDTLDKIAAVLKIIPSIIYDDYLNFTSNNYGYKIKELRKELGLTQKELSNLLAVHRKTVGMWEKEQSYPTKENYLKLAKIKAYYTMDKPF